MRFFGRGRATEELLLRVLSVRLLLQFAPSGVGKTSLLNAGLFPRLRPHGYFPLIVRLNEEKESLTEATRRSLTDAAAAHGLKEPVIPENADSLWALLAGTQLWSDDLLLLTPVLAFDQFEEVFTLRDEAFRRGFAREIGELSGSRAYARSVDAPARESRPPDVKIIISLREEYLGKLEEFTASIPDLFHERLRLAPLTDTEARDAIVEPARMEGGPWPSKPFEFEPACLDQLIDFIDGVSDRFRVIEPLTLQLVCQQAETIAAAREKKGEGPMLALADFGGTKGLESLVQNYFKSELEKLEGAGTRRRAKAMFEQGLVDPNGKRLMLEQGEIERRYGLDRTALNRLEQSRLLRREPRNESVFYEISHDRLTDAIARNRSVRLPGWVKPTIAAGLVFIVGLVVLAAVIARARNEADAARTRAEEALDVLLGEKLVSRLREAGLEDALKSVLDDAHIDTGSRSVALALKLRHLGDISRDRETVEVARKTLTESRAVIEALIDRPGGNSNLGLLAERARTLKRLADLTTDAGEVAKAEPLYVQSVQVWDQVLKDDTLRQEALDAAETRLAFSALALRMGDTARADSLSSEAAHIALAVVTTAYDRVQSGQPDGFFELGRAMQVYADAALSLANLSGGALEVKSAHALARESLRLRPLSSAARIQVGVASAIFGRKALEDSTWAVALDLFNESRRQFEELTELDPANRRLQRERAALRVLIAEGVATCAATPACKTTLRSGALEDADLSTLESIGVFRWLSAQDHENRSLQEDIAWGLRTRAKLLGTRGSPAKALPMLDEAVTITRASIADPRDIEGYLDVVYLLHDKASLLDQGGRALEALGTLDESLAEIDRLPDTLPGVMWGRANTGNARIALLTKLGRRGEAAEARTANDALLERIGTPWDARSKRALALNDEGIALGKSASTLSGEAAASEFRRALDKYKLASAEYPFEYTYWLNQRRVYDSIERLEKGLEDAAATPASSVPGAKADAGAARPHVEDREAALRGALTTGWMARVLSSDETAADSWKDLYEARRSLAIFLSDHGRSAEVLPLVVQGALDAEEYARQQPKSVDALFDLADAHVGLGMARANAGTEGWEEALRKGLAYGEQLAGRELASAERQNWIGSFRTDLANRLEDAHREAAAAEEYRLAVRACREALRLSKSADPERGKAQSCLDTLATAGYR